MAKTFDFGVLPENISGELRKMATAIDNGDVLINSVTDNVRRTQDEFEVKHLVIRYHEKK